MSSIHNLRAIAAPIAGSEVLAGSDPAGAPAIAAPQASPGTRVFRNTFVQLLGRVVSLLLSVVTSVLLARYLGRGRLGEYGALYAYLGLYTWLASFGLEQILAREASQRRLQAGSIFFTGSVVGICLAFAGTGFALLLAPWFGFSHGMRLLLLFAAVDIMLLPSMSFASIVFQVDLRQWYPVGFGLFRQTLWLLAVILLARGGAGFFWVIALRTMVAVLTALLTLPFCWQKKFLPRPVRFSWSEARQLLRYGLPVALSAVAVGVYHRIDQVMLHKMTGDVTLGPYVVAVQMAELFSALPVALMSSLFPILSRTAHQEEQFRHYLGVSYRFLMAVVFFVCAILIPIAAPLVNLFYGKEFQSSAGLLIVLIWSEVPVFFGVVLTSAVMAKGLQRYLPVSTAVGALMNIVLNFLFIPRWGALGSSWATVMSYTVAALFFIAFRPTRSLTLQGVRLALRPLALVLGITVVLQFLPWVFWWKFVAACACYVAGAWAMGIVLHSELRRVWELIRSNSLLFGCNQPLAISYPLRKAPGDRKD